MKRSWQAASLLPAALLPSQKCCLLHRALLQTTRRYICQASAEPVCTVFDPGGVFTFNSITLNHPAALSARYRPTSMPWYAAAHWMNASHVASVSERFSLHPASVLRAIHNLNPFATVSSLWRMPMRAAQVTYYNRAGPPMPVEQLAVGYAAALTAALSITLGYKTLATRFPILMAAGMFAPYPAAAGANICNTAVMRAGELNTGIPVYRKVVLSSGAVEREQVGVSKLAARQAISDTCITRGALRDRVSSLFSLLSCLFSTPLSCLFSLRSSLLAPLSSVLSSLVLSSLFPFPLFSSLLSPLSSSLLSLLPFSFSFIRSPLSSFSFLSLLPPFSSLFSSTASM